MLDLQNGMALQDCNILASNQMILDTALSQCQQNIKFSRPDMNCSVHLQVCPHVFPH